MKTDTPTLRNIILAYLDASPENVGRLEGLPRTYMGLPVDLSNLDAPINGYVMRTKSRSED